MNRVKSVYLNSNKYIKGGNNRFLNNNGIINNFKNGNQINQIKSISKLSCGGSGGNNNNNSLSIINNGYKIREISFLSNLFSNFKNLMQQEEGYEKMVDDIDRIFLGGRIAKKRALEEEEKRKMEEKMEAYSKSAEQRAKEEVGLSEEEIAERRKAEQLLYEELLKEKEKTEGKQQAHKMPTEKEEVSQIVADGKLLNPEQDIELTKIKNDNLGIRPLPMDPDREEPSFEECQDFSFLENFEVVDYAHFEEEPREGETEEEMWERQWADGFLTFEEQGLMLHEALKKPREKFRELDQEARTIGGLSYPEIDWDSFMYTKEEVEALPPQLMDFIMTKARFENPEIFEESRSKADDVLSIGREYTGHPLDRPDNPSLYPVVSKLYSNEFVGERPSSKRREQQEEDDGEEELLFQDMKPFSGSLFKNRSPYPWYKDLDYHIPRLLCAIVHLGRFSSPPNYYLMRLFEKSKREMYNRNAAHLFKVSAPGMDYKKVLSEALLYFLPNFFYHFFQGNLRELEQYTTEGGLERVTTMISRLEGPNRILCGDTIKVDGMKAFRFAPNDDGGIGLVFITSVFHTLAYRDYNGDMIPLKPEFEETMYKTKFKVGLRCDPSKNDFGWTVFALSRGVSFF